MAPSHRSFVGDGDPASLPLPSGELKRAHLRYVATEAAVSAVFGVVLSVVFVFVAFGRYARVPVDRLILDTVPQTLMIGFMSMLVPTLLTRRRILSGVCVAAPGLRLRVPRRAWVRAALVAATLTPVAWAIASVILAHGGSDRAFWAVVVAKGIYGTVLAASVAALAARAALSDPCPR